MPETALSRTIPLSTRYLWLFPLGLIIAGVWAFQNGLNGTMVFDDNSSIVDDLFVHRFGPWSQLFQEHRPFLRITFALNYFFGGLDVLGYHLVNLGIHIIAGLTLFGIIRRTIHVSKRLRTYIPQAAFLAFCSSLIWLVHPLQTASVTYIVQRGESLMGLFYLSCLYFIIRGATTRRWRSMVWYGGAVIAFTVGIGIKEVIATAPLILLLFDRIFLTTSWREVMKRRWIVYLIMFSPGLIWLIINMLPVLIPASLRSPDMPAQIASAGFNVPGITPFKYAATQPGVILHYLSLTFWPSQLVIDYKWPFVQDVTAHVLPIVLICVLLIITGWALIKRPAAGFLCAGFFIILAPTSSIMPIVDPIFEHRMYLSLAAVIILVVFGMHILISRFPSPLSVWVQSVLVGVMALTLSLRTIDRNEDYRSPMAIWEQAISIYPENQRAHVNLGVAYNRAGNLDKALEHYLIAIDLEPHDALTMYNLGFGFYEVGRVVEARFMYNQIFTMYARAPIVSKTCNQLGLIALTENDLNTARQMFQRAVRVFPPSAVSHSNLALVEFRQGNFTEAQEHIEDALMYQPDFAEAYYQRGVVHERLDQKDKAIESYARAVSLKPDYYEATLRSNRLESQKTNAAGLALVKTGKSQEALALFNTAVEQDPTNPLVYNNLGNTYLLLKQSDKAIEYYQASLRIEPDQAEPMSNIAWVLATHPDETVRNPNEAMDLAEQACRLADNPGPALLDTRAAAYAATGQFGKGVNDMRRAIRLAQNQQLESQLQDYRARLAMYRKKQPYFMPK